MSNPEQKFSLSSARLDLDNVYKKKCSHLASGPCLGCIQDRQSSYMEEYVVDALAEIERLTDAFRTLAENCRKAQQPASSSNAQTGASMYGPGYGMACEHARRFCLETLGEESNIGCIPNER